MKWFPSYFNVTITLDPEKMEPGKLGIITVDAENDKIHEAFAMSDERAEEIGSICFDAYKNCKSFDESVIEVEKHLVHVNELVYAIFILSEVRSKLNNPVNMILSDILGGRKGPES